MSDATNAVLVEALFAFRLIVLGLTKSQAYSNGSTFKNAS